MPRFHFNFQDGPELSVDEHGLELESVEAAYLEAFRAAQDIWRERLRARRDPRSCAFEITDSAGAVLLVLPFEEVLEACGDKKAKSKERAFSSARPSVIETAEKTQRLTAEIFEQMRRTQLNMEKARQTLARASVFAPLDWRTRFT